MRVLLLTHASLSVADAGEPHFMEKALRAVLPASNLDFESLYPTVSRWWVEVSDAGYPQREIGFAESGEPIVAGPLGRNCGYWTDSSEVFEVDQHEPVPAAEFEEAWVRFQTDWFLICEQKQAAAAVTADAHS